MIFYTLQKSCVCVCVLPIFLGLLLFLVSGPCVTRHIACLCVSLVVITECRKVKCDRIGL